jgi:hypothetical protein
VPSERPEGLRQQQLLFANHVRNPSAFPAPVGVEERRMRIYRQLFFGNISQLLSTTFPVIRSILDDKKWEALVADFYAMHRCETPLFPFIAGEFADYVVNERNAEGDYPFLAELAQYEWSEIALRHSDAVLPDAELPDVDGSKPMLSPLCWPMVFSFPVHRIGMNYLPQHAPPEPTCLLVYRQADGVVKFMESSPATFRLLQLLQDDSIPTMQAVCEQLADEMQHPDIASLEAMVHETVGRLSTIGVICLPL